MGTFFSGYHFTKKGRTALFWGGISGSVILAVGYWLFALFGHDAHSYFPLSSGWSWYYRLDVNSDDGRHVVLKDAVINLDPVMVQAGPAVPRQTATGNLYFYAQSDDGVQRLAYELKGETGLIEPPVQWLFKLPVDSDQTWQIQTQPFLLIGRTPPLIGMRPEEDVTLTMRAVSTKERVRTPAGFYENCLRIHGTGSFLFVGDSRVPPIHVGVEQTDWYAPGVGLVKSVRRESSDSLSFGSVTVSRTLEGFTKNTF